jgi:hypothetical protein
MAEEATNPVQTVPVEAETIPVQAAPAEPEKPKKGDSLLTVLTVLLVLVGVADLALWGLAVYYLLR